MFIAELEAMKAAMEEAAAEKATEPAETEPIDKDAWLAGEQQFPPKEDVERT